MRIFWGWLCLLLGAPLFVANFILPSGNVPSFIMTGIAVAAGIALLYPRRWMD